MATTFRLALTTLRLFAARDRVFTCVEAPFFRTLVRLRFCFGFFMALIYAPHALAAVLADTSRSVLARGLDAVRASLVPCDRRLAYLVRDLTPARSAVRRREHASAQSGIEGRLVLRISREAVDPAFVGKSVVRQAVPSTEAVGALDDTNVEPGVEPDTSHAGRLI